MCRGSKATHVGGTHAGVMHFRGCILAAQQRLADGPPPARPCAGWARVAGLLTPGQSVPHTPCGSETFTYLRAEPGSASALRSSWTIRPAPCPCAAEASTVMAKGERGLAIGASSISLT